LLLQCLIESRLIYNQMLETIKQQYEDKGTFPSKYELEATFKQGVGQRMSCPSRLGHKMWLY
jgi:hypothetical protein